VAQRTSDLSLSQNHVTENVGFFVIRNCCSSVSSRFESNNPDHIDRSQPRIFSLLAIHQAEIHSNHLKTSFP
jgi:hypothetical protein